MHDLQGGEMNLKDRTGTRGTGLRRRRIAGQSIVLAILIAGSVLQAAAAGGQYIAHNTPPYVLTAKNLGTEDPSKTIEISVWLNLHNRSQMDALAQQLYEPTSAHYRHFLTPAQIAAQFGPTAGEVKAVRAFLESHNLKTVRVGPNNFFVRARGTVGDVESALGVVLNNYSVRGAVVRANDHDPYIEGAAASLVSSISGLDTGVYEYPSMTRTALTGTPAGTKQTAAAKPALVAGATSPSDFPYSNICFPGTGTNVFSNHQGSGSLPIATFKGNILNAESTTSLGCAYTPPELQTAYNLTGLYAEGFDGTGQTIGIVDWCGSLTIQSDANAFSAQFGLPPLTSSNFAINYIPPPTVPCAQYEETEINIDVEWAHAIAPGANINLIVAPSADFQDVDEAEFDAINYGMATVISGSYGNAEPFTPQNIIDTENLISEIAAMSGISTNFASGDDGDFTDEVGFQTAQSPADSPWATAVGGVTLALNPDNSIAWQAGWGNSVTLVSTQGSVSDPPYEGAMGFYAGSGGGPSNCASYSFNPTTGEITCLAGFPKPSYQKALPGKYRQLPDVSWVADPFTGLAILVSVPGQAPEQVWQVWGGTSVAAPMFSGLWAIANQEAGSPLGQAAPYMYSLPADAIYDIVPVSSKTNTTASVVDSSGTTAYSAVSIMGNEGPAKFVSALYDYPYLQYTAYVFSFGTDCNQSQFHIPEETPCNSPSALHTKPGWDNVTGVGVPNAKAFADSFAPAPAVAVKK
jgi:subtilase family serine protease